MLRKRLVSLLLVFAFLFTFLLSGAATETVEKTSVDIYNDLIAALSENPPQLIELDEAAADAYCLQLYNYLEAASAEQLFYGSEETAAPLLKPLSLTLFSIENYWDTTLANADALYTGVWAILHSDEYASQEKSRPALKKTMTAVFVNVPAESVEKAVDLCVDYIIENDPEMAEAGYLKYGVDAQAVTVQGSDEYIAAYKKGYNLFEEGKYEEAIQAYTEALSYKENDPMVSSEIIQAYISLRDYEQAKAWITQSFPYAQEDTYRARFLRAWGFIAIEELDYELGAALYTYSLAFEENASATNELAYIQYIAPDTQTFTQEEAKTYLKEKGIPVE